MGSSQPKLEEHTTMNLLIAITLAVLGVAAAEPGYGYYGHGYHGYGYPAYGYYGHHYGKRSADAEPAAVADAEPAADADATAAAEPGYGYPVYGYGYRHGYGKRSADAEPRYGYYGHGYGYPAFGYKDSFTGNNIILNIMLMVSGLTLGFIDGLTFYWSLSITDKWSVAELNLLI